MRDAFIKQWSWDDDSHTSGRMTVIITGDDMYQSQKTTNLLLVNQSIFTDIILWFI